MVWREAVAGIVFQSSENKLQTSCGNLVSHCCLICFMSPQYSLSPTFLVIVVVFLQPPVDEIQHTPPPPPTPPLSPGHYFMVFMVFYAKYLLLAY